MVGLYFGVAVAAAVVLLRQLMGMRAERRLSACLAAYRAAGQPVEPRDFAGPEPPPEQNAAILLREACEKTVEPRQVGHPIQFAPFDLSHVLDDVPAARQLLSDNTAALELVERACGRPGCEWNLIPAHNKDILETTSIGQLVKLLAIRALVAEQDGEAEAALRALRLAQRVTDCAYRYPVGVGLLIAIGADLIVSSAIEYLSPAMRFERDGARELARAWIDDALDEGPLWHARRRAFLGERAYSLDLLRALRAGNDTIPEVEDRPFPFHPTSVERVLFSPLWTRSAIRSLNFLTDVAEEADSSELLRRWREYRRPDLSIAIGPMSRWFCGLQAVRQDPYLTLHSHILFLGALARRRMAAVAMAIRLYQADHGRMPDTLGELVPEYVPQVPLDPFAAAPAEIRYRVQPAPPVLYSIGRDGIDNGGRVALGDQGLPMTDGSDDLFYLRRGDRPRRPIPRIQLEASNAPGS